jgi:hypothetical protein
MSEAGAEDLLDTGLLETGREHITLLIEQLG